MWSQPRRSGQSILVRIKQLQNVARMGEKHEQKVGGKGILVERIMRPLSTEANRNLKFPLK